MINNKDNPVTWALLLAELFEAREHLEELITTMSEAGAVEETEYAVDLGHVYAHPNRAWHSRHHQEEILAGEWAAFSRFPKDLEPVG